MTAPTTDQLTRRNGVELARTGTWQIGTGEWDATAEDFAAAVAAMSCPAVRAPHIRIGHTDTRFGGDGEPRVGRIENLRLGDGGQSLLGDYADVPGWLNQVMAGAYPDRSVEGTYNKRCQLGHVHPFVLDGLALLGVTRPGVGTLRPLESLADVRNLFAPDPVNASEGEVHIAASIPGSALQAAADTAAPQFTGAMIALVPTAEDAQRLAVDGGEAADQLHLTLAYLGDAADIDPARRQEITTAVASTFDGVPQLQADAFAVSVFNPADDEKATCLVLGLSAPWLDMVQQTVVDVLNDTSFQPPEQHSPWLAHLTLIYTDDLKRVVELAAKTGPVTFDRLRIAFAGQNVDIPFLADGWDDLFGGSDVEAASAHPGSGRQLKSYWVKGKGSALIRWGEPRDFYRCVTELGKYVADPQGLCNTYHVAALGVAPGQEFKHAHASATEVPVPNPQPTQADLVKAAWNATAPYNQYVVRVNASDVVVLDDTDRSYLRVPVTVDGDKVSFGAPRRVMPDYVDYDEQTVAASVVYAGRGESRPDAVHASYGDPPAPATDPPTPDPVPLTTDLRRPPDPGGLPATPPAAEPAPTDPKKEDPVSTLSTEDVRSRLGLPDDADDATILATLDGLKAKADQPAAPDPVTVAASATVAAERDELRKEVKVLASQMEQVTTELAAAKAEKVAVVKASVLDDAQAQGKFAPTDREQWGKDYDEAPSAVTRILASIAIGTAVPVLASGHTGTNDPVVSDVDTDLASGWATQLGLSEGALSNG